MVQFGHDADLRLLICKKAEQLIYTNRGSVMSVVDVAVGGTRIPEAENNFRILKTVFKMLRNRGYKVLDQQINQTYDAFILHYQDKNPQRHCLTIKVKKLNDPTDQLYVFFAVNDNVGVKIIRGYCENMRADSVYAVIIVYPGKLTPFAQQAIKVSKFLFIVTIILSNHPQIMYKDVCQFNLLMFLS